MSVNASPVTVTVTGPGRLQAAPGPPGPPLVAHVGPDPPPAPPEPEAGDVWLRP